MATAKGKTIRVASIDKRVIDWAEKGISDEQIAEAFELAVQDREFKGEAQPITPGFIDVFLCKLLNPKDAGSKVNGHGKPWYCSASAIEAKGREKGIEQRDDEAFPTFRDRVFSAYGVTAADVQQAQRDFA